MARLVLVQPQPLHLALHLAAQEKRKKSVGGSREKQEPLKYF
jgi:hypothetical protein